MCFFVPGLLHLPFPLFLLPSLLFSMYNMYSMNSLYYLYFTTSSPELYYSSCVVSPRLLSFDHSDAHFQQHSPFLPPSAFSSCQSVYICPAHGRAPNKVERIRGEKTALLPAKVSQSFSLSLSFSLLLSFSDSRYVSANVLLTYSAAMKYQQNSYPHS